MHVCFDVIHQTLNHLDPISAGAGLEFLYQRELNEHKGPGGSLDKSGASWIVVKS